MRPVTKRTRTPVTWRVNRTTWRGDSWKCHKRPFHPLKKKKEKTSRFVLECMLYWQTQAQCLLKLKSVGKKRIEPLWFHHRTAQRPTVLWVIPRHSRGLNDTQTFDCWFQNGGFFFFFLNKGKNDGGGILQVVLDFFFFNWIHHPPCTHGQPRNLSGRLCAFKIYVARWITHTQTRTHWHHWVFALCNFCCYKQKKNQNHHFVPETWNLVFMAIVTRSVTMTRHPIQAASC